MKVRMQYSFIKAGEPILFGINNYNQECECCGELINITEVGIGFLSVAIAIEK